MTNPLLDFSHLPRFAAIRPEHVAPAVDALVAEGRATIERIAASDAAPTWESFVQPLDDANERLSRAWSQVSHLNAVVNTPGAARRLQRRAAARHPVLRRAGAGPAPARGLQGAARRERFRRISRPPASAASRTSCATSAWAARSLRRRRRRASSRSRRSSRSSRPRFQDNLLDATNAFALYVTDERELSGIPADVVQAARDAALREARAGAKLTLHMPCYLPVMQYADHQGLRERMYRAFVTRASELGQPDWDNGVNIARILGLRAELSRLLGYRCFAEVSLATKMAGSPAEVLAFLDDLARRARPFAERDMAELAEFARTRLDLADVRAWDVAYVGEKLRQARYAFSDQEVKQYFPENEVLAGMFRLVETLYGVRIRRGRGRDVASRRALLRDRRRGGEPHRPVLPRPLRARGQARRRLDGRRGEPPAHRQPRADAGRLPHLQLLRARGRQARALHATPR